MRKHFIIFLAIVCLVNATIAQTGSGKKAAPPKSMQEAAANYCLANIGSYLSIQEWIKTNKGKKPPVPVPPAYDPDCHDCNEADQTDDHINQINQWIQKTVMQPEGKMIEQLLKMDHEWQMIRNSGDPNDFPSCFNKFSSAEFEDMITTLINRVYNDKVIKMANHYKSEYKYAMAGMQCLFSVGRQYVLWMSGKANDDEVISLARDWLQNYYNSFEKRLFTQYQYQLFPVFLSIERQIQLLGGEATTMHEDLEKWMNKFISFMHFKLNIKFDAEGDDLKGGEFFANMEGEVELHCRLDNNCFVWEPVDGTNSMKFKINGIKTKTPQGVARYNSPTTFTAPIQVTINMCDKNPQFRIVFDKLWPETEYYDIEGGGRQSMPVLYGIVYATLASVNSDKIKDEGQKMQDDMTKMMGSEADIKAFTARVQAHQHDTAYFYNTEQGRKDLRLLNQLKAKFGTVSKEDQDKMNGMKEAADEASKKANDPNYMGSKQYYDNQAKMNAGVEASQRVMKNNLHGAFSLLKIDLPFTIGSKTPVNGRIYDKVKEKSGGGGVGVWNEADFKVTMENAPDSKDNVHLPGSGQ